MKRKIILLVWLSWTLVQVHGQTRQLSGKIVDAATEAPLPGATISTIGKGGSATADSKGEFSLVVEGKVILIVSNSGYKSQNFNVAVTDSVLLLRIQKEDVLLGEVVVIGYGKQKKKDITSSISSISGKELRELPVTNVNSALQARIPGMQIQNAGHQPGAGTTARIRGINSITQGTGPIYVVDGVIVTYDLREINPNDIESIDVLKDASAAAIYGARAAEGVVIITTRKATAGRTSINYDGYYGVQKMIKGYDFIDNIDDYVHLRRLGWNDEDPNAWPIGDPAADAQLFSAAERESIQDRKWYDWVGSIKQNGPMQSHSVSLSNGVGKNRFYLSGNYLNQEGIIKGSDFIRYSVKANMESEINTKTKVGINTNFSHIKNDIVSNEAYYSALTMSPLLPIYGEDGKPLANIDPSAGTILYNNPVTLTQSPIQRVDDRLIGNIYGEYKIIKDLQFRTSFGVDVYKNQQFEYYPRTTSTGYSKNGIAKVQNFGYRDFLWENTLTYDFNPGTNHSFNFLGGVTYQKRRQEWNYEEASGFPTDALTYKNMSLASNRDNISSDYFDWSIASFLGRVIYKFKDRYIINVTARRDGSSRFGSQNRYAFFPSVSGAWRLIDEPFIGLKTRSVISDAKIRVSYGVIGNQEIPYDAIFLRMNPAAYPYNGQSQTTGYQVGTSVQGNDALKWESQRQFNAGLDLAVFSSRVRATFDFYNKDIRNLLLQIPLPVSQGYDSKWINVAAMNTKGIDLGLKFHIIKKTSFDWQMDVNWSKYVSKITALLPGRDSLSPYLKTGEAPNSLLVDYVFDGLYQQGDDFSLNPNARPGDVRVKDLDKNGLINQYDRTIVGRTVPKGWGGIWNYVRYKQISMTVFANYMYGHDISNRAYQDYLYSTDNRRRILKDGLNYWTPTNTNTNIPRPNVFSRSIQALPAGTSSFIVQKGDFIRVRNITLSYDFSQKLLVKAKISSLRVYTQVLEPFLFTKYKGIDPEISAGSYDIYPRYRTFLFGLQLGL
jgi:TonB-linked SusC/RagA family outer membrane protein